MGKDVQTYFWVALPANFQELVVLWMADPCGLWGRLEMSVSNILGTKYRIVTVQFWQQLWLPFPLWRQELRWHCIAACMWLVGSKMPSKQVKINKQILLTCYSLSTLLWPISSCVPTHLLPPSQCLLVQLLNPVIFRKQLCPVALLEKFVIEVT